MKYDDLIKLPVEEVRAFATANPDHIGANNALRMLEHEEKQKKVLKRLGKKTATVPGSTKQRYRASMRRTPTDRELRQ